MASVECSVAGGFFKHLPKIVPICGPSPYKSARWCREQLRPTELPTNSTINTPSPAASSGVHEEMSQDAETLSAEAIAVDARAGSLSVTSGGGSPTGGGACADLPGSLHVSADANGLRVGGYARQRLHTLPALATPPLCSRHCTIVTSSHALARVCVCVLCVLQVYTCGADGGVYGDDSILIGTYLTPFFPPTPPSPSPSPPPPASPSLTPVRDPN